MLRVLEERTYERVGGGEPLRADVRLVAATNRDLQAMVEAGEFRSDLFFRLDVFPIELPPLRERASDVPPLARHLLARARRAPPACEPAELTPAAAELLAAQPWPGNVRQLANVLERALILHARRPARRRRARGGAGPAPSEGSASRCEPRSSAPTATSARRRASSASATARCCGG